MQGEFKRMASKALSFVAMASLPLALYFMMFAGESIGFLSGAAYQPAAAPMRIILPTVVFIGMSNILGMQVLVPTGREKEVLKSVALGGMVDLALNLALIPRLGASGAAIGTLAAEMVVLAVQAVSLRRFLAEIRQECKLWHYAMAALPAMAASWLLKITVSPAVTGRLPAEAGHFLVLAVTAAAFFGIYGGGLLLAKEPIVMEHVVPYLGKIWKRKNNH